VALTQPVGPLTLHAGKGLRATATGHALLRGLALGTAHRLCGLPLWIKGPFARRPWRHFPAGCRVSPHALSTPQAAAAEPPQLGCAAAVPAQAGIPSNDTAFPEPEPGIWPHGLTCLAPWGTRRWPGWTAAAALQSHHLPENTTGARRKVPTWRGSPRRLCPRPPPALRPSGSRAFAPAAEPCAGAAERNAR